MNASAIPAHYDGIGPHGSPIRRKAAQQSQDGVADRGGDGLGGTDTTTPPTTTPTPTTRPTSSPRGNRQQAGWRSPDAIVLPLNGV
ncbi:hypothetical protein GCM10009608_34040 [Pseudonocardia alaniniphila]